MPVNIVCTNSQEKLNPVGAYILAHHYKTNQSRKDGQNKIVQPIYCLNSPRDIPLMMHCLREEGVTQYGLIVVAGGRHRTPLVVNNNQCYILESLGTKSLVGKNSVTQIAIAISKSVALPWSYFQPASRIRSSAAFNSIAISDSLKDVP